MHDYEEYVHGHPSGDRRVVIDSQTLSAQESSGDIQVFHPDDLLERFLATLRTEMELAEQLKQPVLLLNFGPGDEATYGISLGGSSQHTEIDSRPCGS